MGAPGDSVLLGIDVATGTTRWSRFLSSGDPGAIATPPVVTPDGLVVVGVGDDRLLALAAGNGRPRWDVTLPMPMPMPMPVTDAGAGAGSSLSSPAVADGVVTVHSGRAETLFAFDAVSGAPLWERSTARPAGPDEVATPDAATTPERDSTYTGRAMADGMVYVTLGDRAGGQALAGRSLLALDARTGDLRWEQALPDLPLTTDLPASYGPPMVAGDQVLVLDGSGGDLTIRTFDAVSGAPGRETVVARVSGAGRSIAGTTLYLATPAGRVLALDLATGTETWSVEGVATPGDGLVGAPVVTGGRVYVAWPAGPLVALGDPPTLATATPATATAALSTPMVDSGATPAAGTPVARVTPGRHAIGRRRRVPFAGTVGRSPRAVRARQSHGHQATAARATTPIRGQSRRSG